MPGSERGAGARALPLAAPPRPPSLRQEPTLRPPAPPWPTAVTERPKSSPAGTDGGWIHTTPLKTRYASPTGIMSFDGESAWPQYDPRALVPKEWGKQGQNWKNSLRDWPDPDKGMWQAGQAPKWKSVNYNRWPLYRIPKYTRSGIEVNL